MNKLFWIIIAIVIIQRLVELLLAKRHERILKSKGALEYDKNGYRFIVLMHAGFFISIVTEYIIHDRTLNQLWIPLLIILILAQLLRYWAISSLGNNWNTKILVVPGAKLVRVGPYKYLKHPNYLAVIIEIAVLPLMFSCYITSIVFSLLNIIVLRRRVRLEESALMTTKPDA